MKRIILWVVVALLVFSVVANVFLVNMNLQVQNQFNDLDSAYEILVSERDSLKPEVAALPTVSERNLRSAAMYRTAFPRALSTGLLVVAVAAALLSRPAFAEMLVDLEENKNDL